MPSLPSVLAYHAKFGVRYNNKIYVLNVDLPDYMTYDDLFHLLSNELNISCAKDLVERVISGGCFDIDYYILDEPGDLFIIDGEYRFF